MITGIVSGSHPTVRLRVRIPGQPDIEIEFVVDTGFTGFLTLPAAAVAALGLPFLQRIPANLADGSFLRIAMHTATIVWDGVEHEVDVLAMGREPLLGASLLKGHDLWIRFTDGGPVTIEPISLTPLQRP